MADCSCAGDEKPAAWRICRICIFIRRQDGAVPASAPVPALALALLLARPLAPALALAFPLTQARIRRRKRLLPIPPGSNGRC
ncbi:hypothetical protein YDYSY3_47880 [Paenibacillus chitinolyticus]|nr:hypothetical protein YDYSY3_47880 [Paenibacillus chitinolyticus]